MTRGLFGSLGLLLGAALLGAPLGAQPRPAPPLDATLAGEARVAYDVAQAQYRSGEFAAALAAFRRAHELSGDPRLLQSMSACHRSLGRFARALPLAERALREGERLLTAEQREVLVAHLGRLKDFTGLLAVAVDPEGAEIFVDDEKVGEAPLPAPVLVDVGPHRVRVAKPGFEEAVRALEVQPRTPAAVALTLARVVREGRLVLEAPPGATIALDGELVGQGRWEGTVAGGRHAVRVTAPGRVPYPMEVVVQAGETRRIPIVLEAAPRASTAWLWVGGGAAVTAALVVGGFFLFRPRDKTMVPGTFPVPSVQLAFGREGARLEGAR